MMAPIFTSSALLLLLATSVVGQSRIPSAIPDAEAAALAAIVEDDPSTVPFAKKALSPKYPSMFGRPLPIPPVKQPKKLVTTIYSTPSSLCKLELIT